MNRQQLLAVLWLRWRLSRNQFVRAGRLNAAISVIVVLLLVAGALALGVGGFLLGFFVVAKAPQMLVPLAVWDGIMFALLIFWGTGLMVEIQRSESVDIYKLLHLPIHLRQVFFLNYVSSLASPILILFVPLVLGVAAGQTLGGGLLYVLVAFVALAFLFALTAWTYCIRGWLAALMTNKRRRRTVVFWITIIFVALSQMPNLLFNSPKMRQTRHGRTVQNIPLDQRVVRAHVLIPPGWVGYGAFALHEGNPWPAVAGTAAGTLLGILGLMRAYTLTIRFYTGVGKEAHMAGKRKLALPTRPQSGGTRRPLLVERHIPFLSEDTAALTLATLRSLLRAPELRWAMLTPIFLGIVMSGARLANPGKNLPSELILQFAGTGAILLSCFAFGTAMCNSFGLDRDGFRALILLPTKRHFVLLAKNLAFLPFLLSSVVLLVIIARVLWKVPLSACLLAPLQLVVVFPLFSLVCNTMSILVPYRIAPGTLNAKKPKAIIFVGILGTMIVMPLAILPGAIPPVLQVLFWQLKWAPWFPINFLSALILIPLTAGLYWAILPSLGQLLQRREVAILSQVTEEVE